MGFQDLLKKGRDAASNAFTAATAKSVEALQAANAKIDETLTQGTEVLGRAGAKVEQSLLQAETAINTAAKATADATVSAVGTAKQKVEKTKEAAKGAYVAAVAEYNKQQSGGEIPGVSAPEPQKVELYIELPSKPKLPENTPPGLYIEIGQPEAAPKKRATAARKKPAGKKNGR